MRMQQVPLWGLPETEIDPSVDGLRPEYQEPCVQESLAHVASGKKRGLIKLFTGGGKTLTAIALTRRWLLSSGSDHALWLAPRTFLIEDAIARLRPALGTWISREQAASRGTYTRMTVGSMQTFRGDRLLQMDPERFGLIVCDECFPAGTLVDGKPIETLKVGDIVWSVDHDWGIQSPRKIVRVSRKLAPALLKLTTTATELMCTPNHPIFVKGRGYVEAAKVLVGDLLCVWSEVRTPVVRESTSDVRVGVPRSAHWRDGDQDLGIRQTRRHSRADADSQSNEDGRSEGTGVGDPQENRPSSNRARRKRNGGDSRGEGNRRSDGHAAPGSRQDGPLEGPVWVSDLLQNRRGGYGPEDSNRSRWGESLDEFEENPGCQERFVLAWTRVDRVESLESASSGGTPVYNFEVEGTHNYFANGLLVHNCQVFDSPGALKIFDHFKRASFIGLSATPGDAKAFGGRGSIIFNRDILWGQQNGYIVPFDPRYEDVTGLDLSDVDSVDGDLKIGDLDRAVVKVAVGIAKLTYRICEDRPTLIYCPGVATVHAVTEWLNEQRPGCAVATTASTPPKVRRQTLQDFKDGKIQYIVNCGIYLFGLDVPTCRAVVIARPTEDRDLWEQMVGRLGRPAEGIGQLATAPERHEAIARSSKPNGLLLILSGQTGKHSLCDMGDLDETADPAVRKKASEDIRADPKKPLSDALRDARAWQRKENERITLAMEKARLESKGGTFDPFAAPKWDRRDPHSPLAPKWVKEPATDAQRGWLRWMRLPQDVTKFVAGQFRGRHEEWTRDGKPSWQRMPEMQREYEIRKILDGVRGRIPGEDDE